MNDLIATKLAPTVIVRPDRPRKPYRMKARFRVPAYPNKVFFKRAFQEAADMFIRDMAKQGWEYLDAHGVRIKEQPFPVTPIVTLPSVDVMKQWDINAKVGPDGRRIDPGAAYVKDVLPLDRSEFWEFEFSAVFLYKAISAEVAD